MADWSIMDRDWPVNQYDPYQYGCNPYYQEKPQADYVQPQAQSYMSPPSPGLTLLLVSPENPPSPTGPQLRYTPTAPKGDSPREIRNKAEKQRRDKLNQSIAELAAMVPPVVAASRKIDKTGILRLTAHYLRAHQYVFGDSIGQSNQDFSSASTQAVLSLLNGFLLTTTYKGLVVVASQNVQQYLGYTELELLGQNIFNIVHEDDRQMMRDQLMPNSNLLGSNGELLIPDEPNGKKKVEDALANEKRRFVVRFKKLSQRSEPCQYITCHVEGTLRKSDRACRGYNRCCQMVRRARARGDNPCSSGNDIVFVGMVRPTSETFITESGLESFRMEYRTRHSIDGQIIECEQRIALVTGYMTHEVNGVNAMNFMHRDDVRWVIIALREMYDQHRLFGESCYRLMTKNGQFIYMRTRGRLDVDQSSRAVTSFVCTNTVVEEEEGKHLIKMMKKKFALMVNNNEEPPQEEEPVEVSDNQSLPVEDPRQLEKVILHLVTNLPSPQPNDDPQSEYSDRGSSPSLRLAIIPPRKERIVRAIEKIYSVINTLPRSRVNRYQDNRLIDDNGKANLIAPPPIVSEVTTSSNSRENESILALAGPTTSNPEASSSHLTKLPAFSNIYHRRQNQNSNSNDMRNVENNSNRSSETVSQNTYTGMASITFSNINSSSKTLSNSNQTGNVKCHAYVPQKTHTDGTLMNNVREMNSIPSGVKRPRDFTDQETISKKKVSDVPKADKIIGQISEQQSPSLDTFFDEELLNTQFSQIDTAINSLEQTIIDPTFPDLLISKEVQDILGEIDDTPNEENPNT